MPKPVELSADILTPPPVPKAAQPPVRREASPEAPAEPQGRAGKTRRKPITKAETVEPLQVRWPVQDAKAARLAAIQMDFPTVSAFMLACFHAYMRNKPETTK